MHSLPGLSQAKQCTWEQAIWRKQSSDCGALPSGLCKWLTLDGQCVGNSRHQWNMGATRGGAPWRHAQRRTFAEPALQRLGSFAHRSSWKACALPSVGKSLSRQVNSKPFLPASWATYAHCPQHTYGSVARGRTNSNTWVPFSFRSPRAGPSRRLTIGDCSVGRAPPTYQFTCRPPCSKVFSNDPPHALTHKKIAFFHSTQPAYLLNFGAMPFSRAFPAAASWTTPRLPKWGQGTPRCLLSLARSADKAFVDSPV